jgi:hypothetical protein
MGGDTDDILREMQQKFYNISRLMDCVSCDRCRLNGKVQMRGMANVLKALFLPEVRKGAFFKEIG